MGARGDARALLADIAHHADPKNRDRSSNAFAEIIADHTAKIAQIATGVCAEQRRALAAQALDDHNPLHLDDAFAATTANRGRLAHGLLLASLGSAVV